MKGFLLRNLDRIFWAALLTAISVFGWLAYSTFIQPSIEDNRYREEDRRLMQEAEALIRANKLFSAQVQAQQDIKQAERELEQALEEQGQVRADWQACSGKGLKSGTYEFSKCLLDRKMLDPDGNHERLDRQRKEMLK